MCIQYTLSIWWTLEDRFPDNTCAHVTRASVAEVAKYWLLKVKEVMLDSLANTVLPLDSVTSHVGTVCPGPGPLNEG